MAILTFKEALENIERPDDVRALQRIWDLACESCAQIADDCIEFQIGSECRDLKNE